MAVGLMSAPYQSTEEASAAPTEGTPAQQRGPGLGAQEGAGRQPGQQPRPCRLLVHPAQGHHRRHSARRQRRHRGARRPRSLRAIVATHDPVCTHGARGRETR